MIRNFLFSWIVFSVSFSITHAEIPADISFIVIDLKYNSNDGVKICEMQQGIKCSFNGVGVLEGSDLVIPEMLQSYLSQYYGQFWYVRKGLSNVMNRGFYSFTDWRGFSSFKEMIRHKSLRKKGKLKVADPCALCNYHGIVICSDQYLQTTKLQNYKGVSVLNAALLPLFGQGKHADKYSVNIFFDTHELLKSLRPAWNTYPKNYSESLVSDILADFFTDILVIKPQSASQGRGVIILNKNELDDTLKYILEGGPKLEEDPDKAYSWWAKDSAQEFIVEEFIASDPVFPPHLNEKPYDGTMRVAVILSYDRQEMQLQFLNFFWKLPEKSLFDEGSLNEKHKSFSRPNLQHQQYSLVDVETQERVKEQLREGLFLMYGKFLGIKGDNF